MEAVGFILFCKLYATIPCRNSQVLTCSWCQIGFQSLYSLFVLVLCSLWASLVPWWVQLDSQSLWCSISDQSHTWKPCKWTQDFKHSLSVCFLEHPSISHPCDSLHVWVHSSSSSDHSVGVSASPPWHSPAETDFACGVSMGPWLSVVTPLP